MVKRSEYLLGLIWILATVGTSIPERARSSPILVDTQDTKIRDATNPNTEAVGTEPSIAVDPDNWRILLVSIIASGGCSGWFSTDGGFQWQGDNQPAYSPGDGDPSVAILRGSPTRYFIQSIATPESDPSQPGAKIGQRVTWADAPTASWTGPATGHAFIMSGEEQTTDKGFLCADNNVSSSFSGRMYSLWYRTEGGGLRLRYSLAEDRGEDWRPQPGDIQLRPTGVTWGGVINVATASSTLGHVYVAWPNSPTFSQPPSSMSFRRSNDVVIEGFSPAVEITDYPGGAFNPRATLPGGLNTGANSIPSMATDDLGNIYVAWGQRRRTGDGNGTDAQIYVSKSTDEGDTWGPPVPMTASTSNQWLPWIAWDNGAKALAAVCFDDRDDPNLAEVYLAVSYDRGASFVELPISDAPGSGDVFVGDYISIACGGGVAYPVWCDDRESGVVKAFTSPILIGGIDDTSITAIVGQSCAGVGNPRVRFEVNWSTLANMEGLDELTVTPPGGAPVTVMESSTSKTHHLVIYDLPCVNGNWTYSVESNKGALSSQSNTLVKSVTCISCPPACHPPCELE